MVCREVVAEQTWFPSFSPADFPACLEAAQKALTLAGQAVAANRGDPQVSKHNYPQTFAQRKTAPSKDFGRACGEQRLSQGTRFALLRSVGSSN